MQTDPFIYGLLSPNTSQKYANIENYEGFNQSTQSPIRHSNGRPAPYSPNGFRGHGSINRQHTPRNKDGTPKVKPERISKLVDLFFADYFVSSYEDSDIDETSKLKRQIEDYKARELKYTQEIDTLTIQNNDLTTQLEEFQDANYDAVSTLEKRVDDLTIENTKMCNEVDILKRELEEIRASSMSRVYEVEGYEQQIKQQRERIEGLVRELATAHTEVTALENQKNELVKSLECTDRQCSTLARKLDQERNLAASEMYTLKAEKDQIRQEYERVCHEMQNIQATYKEHIRLLENDRMQLQDELRSSKTELQSSINEIQNHKRKSIALSMAVPSREMTIALGQKEEEIRKLNSEIKALEDRHRNMTKEIQVAHEIMAMDSTNKDDIITQNKLEVDSLKNQLEALLKTKLELETRVAFLERAIKDKDGAMDLIQERIGTAQKAMALSSGQHNVELSRLRAQLKDSNYEITRLQGEMRSMMQTKDTEINALKLNVATLTERVREYRTRLLEAGNPNVSRGNDLKLLQVVGKESSSTFDSTELDLSALEKELSIKNILIKKKDDDIDFFRSQLVMREAEIERLLSSQTSSCTKRSKTPLKATLKKSKS